AVHAAELADQILDALDADAHAAHRLRDPRVVVAAELGSDEPVAATTLSVLDPAEDAVVEHDGDDRDPVLGGGEERVHRHGEAAVAAHRHAVALGARELGGHGRGKRVAHAADRRRLGNNARAPAL